MKKFLPLFFGLAFSTYGSAQAVNNYTLDLNNVDAIVNDGGVFFNDEQNSAPGFALPSGSQLHTIFSMAFWYAGKDVNGQLKLSAQRYQNLTDQFKGPLTADGAADPPAQSTWTNAIFPVTKSEINDHIANYANPGYVLPVNLGSWPAHGDVSLNQDYYLAPFVDTDGNGNYDPLSGDYPCIRGDKAAYVIMNDRGGLHTTSGGEPLGIEMHYMFYEYEDPFDNLFNTIFVHGKVINRGTQTLFDFKTSVFLDGDIGYSGDDYFGSDSTRNLMYFYNGDNMDETTAGSQGYGDNPPAAGIVSLSHDFESIGLVGANVNTAAQYWNLMNAMDASGMPWINPATSSATNYQFASDPMSATEQDSEQAQANTPGERRGIATIGLGTLVPNQEHEFDLAVIYNRNIVNNVQNASELVMIADDIQQFADSNFVGDCFEDQISIGLEELTDVDFSIFPNPTNGEFTLSLGTDFSDAKIEIRDISGRSITNRTKLISKETHIKIDQPAGIYLVYVSVDGRESVKRIVLK